MAEPEHVSQLVRDDERHRIAILSALNADLRADEATAAALDVRVTGGLEPANPDQHLRVAARAFHELHARAARVPRVRGGVDGPGIGRDLVEVRDRRLRPT